MIQYRPASIDTACSGSVAVAELVRPEPDQHEVERRRRHDVHHGVDHRPERELGLVGGQRLVHPVALVGQHDEADHRGDHDERASDPHLDRDPPGRLGVASQGEPKRRAA